MEEEKIRQVVLDYIESIDTQDRGIFDKVWSDQYECRLISIATEFVGKEAIYEKFVIGGLQKAYESIRLIMDDLSIRMAGPDTAIAVFRYHTECIRRGTGESYGIQGLETQVIVWENDDWKLVQVHYSK